MSGRRLGVAALAILLASCEPRADEAGHARSDAVAAQSRDMSGPSLFARERLAPALKAVRAVASGRPLRIEVRAHELIVQVEDVAIPGSVLELHYKEGRVSEPEQAVLRGKGQLADNLFDYADVKLETIPALTRKAIERVDPEAGGVDYVLIRRNLPESDDVRLRVYVGSPRRSGYIDADRSGQPL